MALLFFLYGSLQTVAGSSFPVWTPVPERYASSMGNLHLGHVLKIPHIDQPPLLCLQSPQYLFQKNPVQYFFLPVFFFRKLVHQRNLRSLTLIDRFVKRFHFCTGFHGHYQFFYGNSHFLCHFFHVVGSRSSRRVSASLT